MSRVFTPHPDQIRELRLKDLDSLEDFEDEGMFDLLDVAQADGSGPLSQDQKSDPHESKESKAGSRTPGGNEDTAPSPPQVDIQAERQQAYEEGLAQGREEMRQELESAAKALLSAAQQLDGIRSSLYANQEQDLVRLAMLIARQVIGAELRTNEEAITGVVENALKSAVETDSHHVRVNPDDLAVVQKHKPLFLANIHGLKEITVEADKTISRGGCVIESETGEVDACLESRLARIEEQLHEAVQA